MIFFLSIFFPSFKNYYESAGILYILQVTSNSQLLAFSYFCFLFLYIFVDFYSLLLTLWAMYDTPLYLSA